MLLAVYPRRETQVAALTGGGDRTVAVFRQRGRCSLESERQLQRKGGECSKISAMLEYVCVCVSLHASPASGLTVDGESLCTVSRSNSSIIYHNKVWGISKANCK